MEDLDIPQSKLGESAEHVVDRALEEARRRGHALLTNEHICLAFAQAEWDTFAGVLRDVELNPYEILQALEEHLRLLPGDSNGQIRVSPSVKLLFKLALLRASRNGRQMIQGTDLFASIFEETQGVPVSIIRRHGIEPDALMTQLTTRVRDRELQEEKLKKRFELPPFLKHFATNLNLLARQDKTPPVFGRDKEMDRAFEILCHRERANSVMLLGEPGVGKTAIAEGMARRIEFEPEKIPPRLRNCQIVNLQMNTMVAGTMLRGMFEDRIQNVIREIQERPNLILFIDEIHTMIGTGAALGAPMDAANVFKAVLGRGEVRIIGATTSSEYKEFIEQDEALARRFRPVPIGEPTLEETRFILERLRPRLERNYSVKIRDEALETSLELAPRYVRNLKLPDKVISWLDTASVKAEVGRRGEVTADDVRLVISEVTKIPVDMVEREVTERFRHIEAHLGVRIVGQQKAVKAVADRLILNKGPLKDNFDRPDGVLLFLGPTGVGKTELAKAVAEFLFGDEKKIIRVDMSEYQDGAIGADKLIGMPRGIVGSEHGGVLTNQLKDRPYSVVLLDEIEKASPSMLNVFLQAFDEGWLTDGRGRRVYLSDAIVIMTSNIGSGHYRALTNGLGFRTEQSSLAQIHGNVRRELERHFTPEFRNRIDQIVIFDPLSSEEVRQIAENHLDQLRRTLAKSRKTLVVEPDAFDAIVREGYSLAQGARELKRVIGDRVKLPISKRWQETTFRIVLRDNRVEIEHTLGEGGLAFA